MIELNRIYNEDCLEGMKRIDDKSIDCIVTDPPYLHIKGGNKGWIGDSYLFTGKKSFNNTYIHKSMSDFNADMINNFLDIIKLKLKKINVILFCSELQLQFYFDWILKQKYKYNLMVWDKGNRVIMNRNRYMSNLEYIIRIYEPMVSLNSIKNNNAYCKLKTNKTDFKKQHDTQKPISLITDFLLLHSNENETVLDPFMGSGTTAIACINTNRNYIGFELDKEYHAIAENRIKEHLLQQKLNLTI